MYKKTKYSTQNTWIIKFKLEACSLLYMLLSMSMYYICTFIPLTPLLIPLSVRLKHPSLSPDRESAPHCRTIALGWYISITLVITYQVIHKTYDSYAELKNSWKYIVLELTSMKRICVFKHITFQYLLYCLCENMSQMNNISLSFKTTCICWQRFQN